MKQVLFDRLKSDLAQCINNGTIYFLTDSNGNFTQIALGDGSKSHVVGIGPKMDDATKQELMSKLGLTISSDMGTIQLGKLSNYNGVSSQKVVTYERNGLGTDTHEISTVGYVQQYMQTAQAMVYAGLFNAQTKEITDYNTAIISPSEEGNVTFDYLLEGYEGETYLTPGMSFIVDTAGNLEDYRGVSIHGDKTNVEVGDIIIITNITEKKSEEGGSMYNQASILVVQKTNFKIADGAITTAKLADESVTASKLSTDIQPLIRNLSKTATFAGIATPTTNPGTPDAKIFYVASTEGTYTYFNNAIVSKGDIAFFSNAGETWKCEKIKVPTKVSQLENDANYLIANEDILEIVFMYGIEFDTTIANPKCTRIGNLELHRTLPIHSKIRGCLLNDNGAVVKYLNPDTWMGEVLDGSMGQVMVEIPEFYIKFEEEGTKRRVKMSLANIAGYKKVSKAYISAYEATVQRSTSKLASVCNTDADYRGGNNNASYDGTYRSFLGLPATYISLNDFRTYARNRGSVEWNCNLYRLHKMLWWLFAVEYANFNSQDTFNAALDDNGYHQGGLGDGVTTMPDWGGFNGYYPIVPCGVTNSLGNHTGTVDYNVIGSDGSTVQTFAVPRYRGIENPFGHIWKWTDGCKCIIQSEASGGLSKFYVCDDPAKFTASGVGNYEYRGDLPRKNGYVKAIILGEDGEIMPLEVGGGSTTYFCDYFYTNIPSSGEAERGVLFGGDAGNGAYAGFVCANTGNAATGANAGICSRLCFIPNE